MGHSTEAGRQGGCGIVDPRSLRPNDRSLLTNSRDNLTKSEIDTIAATTLGPGQRAGTIATGSTTTQNESFAYPPVAHTAPFGVFETRGSNRNRLKVP
jgi:hypothetical protein